MNHYDDDGEEDVELDPYEIQYIGEDKKRQYASKDGKAVAVFPNKDQYEGEYRNHKRNGKGTYRWASKDDQSEVYAQYEGEYKDGKRHGMGTMTYPDQSKYIGQWVDNKRHGHGVYTYINGDKYCGSWERDVRQGQGTYYYASSRTQLTGMWINGQCPEGKWSYVDAELKQRHDPFEAQVKSSKVVKYLPFQKPQPKGVIEGEDIQRIEGDQGNGEGSGTAV